MALRRFAVELGTGADLHGRDMTKACCRAVKDAISHACMCGVIEVAGLKDPDQMHINMLVACSQPELVDEKKVIDQVPFGTVQLEIVKGGMEVQGMYLKELGDSDTIVVANVAITILIDEEDMNIR